MAKTYAAELLLKNKNAINSLEQVQKKVKSLQKELKKPIEVDAKLGSGFKNIESKINKIAPKSKTIRIEATENVTKTMNQVNRQMFEMSNKMNSTINSSMKGWNTQLSASLPKLQALSNTMAAVANTSKIASSMATASGLAGAGAGIAGAAVLGGKDKDNNKKNSISIIDRIKGLGAKIKEIAINLGKKFSKGFIDAVAESKKKFGSIVGKYANIDIDSHGIFASDGSALADMIERQKEVLEELGEENPLKKWKMNDVGFFREWENHMIIMARWSGEVFQEMGQDLKTSMNKAGESIKNKWNNNHMVIMARWTKEALTEAFDYVKAKAMPKINSIGKAIKLWATKGKFAFERIKYFVDYFVSKALVSIGRFSSNAFSKVVKCFENIGNKIVSIIPPKIKKAFKGTSEEAQKAAKKSLKEFTKMANKISSTITKGIGGAFQKIASMGKWAAGAVAGAFGVGLADMAKQEEYITSMTHFISVDDAKANGKNTITKAQAQQRAEGLFDWGTNFANSTPFQNDEVYSAINRMTQVFGYGTDGAQIQKMVKLVGDMAALNPGKTMSDAAEAIADLAVGETERMKEFGLKLTQDDLKALAGVPGQKDSLSQEQILKAFSEMTKSGGALYETFDGGADAIAQTLSGKVSTILGSFRQMIVDSLKPFETDFKAILDNVIGHINGDFGTKFKDTLGNVFKGVKDILTGNKESDIPMVGSILRAFEKLKSALSPIIDNIKSKFGEAGINFDTVGKFIENAIGGISTAIEAISPIINGFINIATWLFSAFAEHPALFTAIGAAIGGLTVLSTIVGIVTGAIGIFNTMTTIINGVKAAFTLLNVLGLGPVALGIAAVIGVGTLLITNWQNICTWASSVKDYALNLWETFKQNPLDAVNKVLGDMVGWLQSCVEWFGKLIGKVAEWGKTKIVNPIKNFFGGGDKGSQNAYGKNRVPYDGYQASLHEGERILTSRQAAQMDAGLLPGQSGGNNNNITINVSGTTDPDTTARMVVQRLKETLENTSVKSFA